MANYRVVLLVGLLLVPAAGAPAKPPCDNKVRCGYSCDYDPNVGGVGGGLCSPGNVGAGAYCWQETVKNDGDTLVVSCQYGQYDQCCDPEIDPQ